MKLLEVNNRCTIKYQKKRTRRIYTHDRHASRQHAIPYETYILWSN